MNITNCVCLWSDLLGYGRNFYESNWDLTTEKALKNFERIDNLQILWTHVTHPFSETVFTLNDGLVRNFDLRLPNFSEFLSWFEDAIRQFNYTNRADKANGHPGLRGVMSIGQRITYIDKDYKGLGDFVQTSSDRKTEYNKKITVYSPRELQMNTAFSKAYIIEGSGSRMGVSGDNLYIDKRVIDYIVKIANSGIEDIFYTAEDDPPLLKYNYKGTFSEFENYSVLEITTTCNHDQSSWSSFKATFGAPREYNNIAQSISTKLYVPIEVVTSLYGQPTE